MMKTIFPILSHVTYVDTASSCIISEELHAWRKKHEEEFFEHGSRFRIEQGSFLESVRKTVKDFFNAKHAFLVPNFSLAFNSFLETLGPEERFLLLDEEYPSISHPVEARGFPTSHVVVDGNIEERIYQAVKEHAPLVFAFSLVQYIDGFALGLDFIKQLKKDFPDLLLVADGTQYCGAGSLDFADSGLDVLAGSGYKWLLGGYGNGYILFGDQIYGRINEKLSKVKISEEYQARGKGAVDAHFEPGHLDTLNFGSLQQSLLSLTSFGMDQIEKQVKTLSLQAKEAFTELSLLDEVIVQRSETSSIFNIKGGRALFELLTNENVICTPRGKGIRISFHFFNTKDDLNKILQIIGENISTS